MHAGGSNRSSGMKMPVISISFLGPLRKLSVFGSGRPREVDPSALCPGAEQLDRDGLEVGKIACHERELMLHRGGSDETVHRADRPTFGLRPRDAAAPGVCRPGIDGKNPSFESIRKVSAEPSVKRCAPASCSKTFDAVPQLRESDHAKVEPIFVRGAEPVHDTGIWTWLDHLRYRIRIEQKRHNPASRTPSSTRVISRPDPRKGEFIRKSAKLPSRFRFCARSQAAASTTTTAFLPLRVIDCGPWRRAFSITSLSRAFACATVQLSGGLSALMTASLR